MAAEWRTYRDKVYPTRVGATQNKECHQAFFAGALVALTKMCEISGLPELEAMAAADKLQKEIMEINQARANQAGPSMN